MAEILNAQSLNSLVGGTSTAIEGAKTSTNIVADLNNLAQNVKEILAMVQKKQDIQGVNPQLIGTAPAPATQGARDLNTGQPLADMKTNPPVIPQAPKTIVIDQKQLEAELDQLFNMAEPFKDLKVADALANYQAFKPQIVGSMINTIRKVTRIE